MRYNQENNLISMFIGLIGYVGKFFISSELHKRDGKKSCEDILDEIDERFTKLEMTKEETGGLGRGASVSQDWETYDAAVERGRTLPPLGWIIPGLIPEGTICNIQSTPKSGKTVLVTQIAHSNAYALPSRLVPSSSDAISNHQEVYVYDAELDDDDQFERNANLGDSKVHLKSDALFDTPSDFLCHLNSSVSNVESNVLVIVDNVTTICPSFTGKDVKKVKTGIAQLQKSFQERGYRLSVILVHHTKAGTDGSSADDRAGSIEWGRVGKLSLTFCKTNIGCDYRALGVLERRSSKIKLNDGEAFILKFDKNPYPHYAYVSMETLSDVVEQNKQKSSVSQSNSTKGNMTTTLTPEETMMIGINYKPGVYGLGRLAKDILIGRNQDPSKEDINRMKDVVKNELVSKGLYQGKP